MDSEMTMSEEEAEDAELAALAKEWEMKTRDRSPEIADEATREQERERREREREEIEMEERLYMLELEKFHMEKKKKRDMQLEKEREVETKTYPPIYAKNVSRASVINFSSQSVTNLRERLFGKGREKESLKKLVYLRVSCRDSPVSWLAVDANAGVDDGQGGKPLCVEASMKPESSFPVKLLPNVAYCVSNPKLPPKFAVSTSCVDEAITGPQSDFPPELRDLTCYGCTVWKSTIVIAGGKCAGVPSDKVFFYNGDSKTWSSPKVMMRPRGAKPTVAAANSHLFVFGGVTDADVASWAEVLLDGCSDFEFLPMLPDVSLRMISCYEMITHVVYENQDQILLLIHPLQVLSFNFVKMEWEMSGSFTKIADGPRSSDTDVLFVDGPRWSDTVVLFEDFLIWHHYGTIYLHDLQNHITVPASTMPRTIFSSAMFNGEVHPPRFLVHTGCGKLCLFYQTGICIRYVTFSVHLSKDVAGLTPEIPGIVMGHSGFLYTPPISEIHHALEVPSK